MAEQIPTENKKAKLTFIDSITVVALLIGVYLVIVVPPLPFKVILLISVCVGVYFFSRHSHWTHGWSRFKQHGVGWLVIALLCLMAIPQFISQWNDEHRLKSAQQLQPSPATSPQQPGHKEPSPTNTPTVKPILPTKPQEHRPVVKSNPIPGQQPVQNCPNGNCIGGDNNGTAIVNNGPPPVVLTVTSIETGSAGTVFSQKEGFIKTEITIVPNQQVTAPFIISLQFDNPISEISHTVKNMGAQMSGGPFWIGTNARETVSTSIGPSHPLVVVVFSVQPVKLVAAPQIVF